MVVELTPQQCNALRQSQAPVTFVDPQTNQTFVLIRSDTFERLQSLLGDDLDPRLAYPAMDRAFSEGWNDPVMDAYDHYEDFKQ